MAKHAGSVFSVDVTGLDAEPGQPAYARICERIRTAIASGALAPNARLPSSRTLAKDLGVARNTIDWALGQLVADGYIVRRRGAGSFVASNLPERDKLPRTPKRTAPSKQGGTKRRLSRRAKALQGYPGHYRPVTAAPFTPSLPPIDLFPRKVWNRLSMREAARPGGDYWAYGASNGLPALREAIAAHASAMRAACCSPDQVIVVTSTQQAVELAGKALADPGDCAWVELPGYPPVQHCLRAAGLQVVRYEGRPIASLQGIDGGGCVVYVGSFNKVLFPGLRIAYAIVPEALVGAFVDAKHVADGHTALLAQGVLAAFIQEGHLARHLRKTRAIYDERRLAFLQEAQVLGELLDFGPARSGMHVTALFKDAHALDDQAVAAACARADIQVHPFSRYGATNRGGLVFGFAGASRADARSGLEIVRRAIVSAHAQKNTTSRTGNRASL